MFASFAVALLCSAPAEAPARRPFMAGYPMGLRYQAGFGSRTGAYGVGYQGFAANGGVKLHESKRTRLGLGVAYRFRLYDLQLDGRALLQQPLHGVTLGLGATHRLDPKWSLGLAGALIVGGDWVRFDPNAVNASVLGTLTYALDPDWTLIFGAIVSRNPNGILPIPILGARWRPSPQWRIEAYVPTHAEVAWLFDERADLALRATLDSMQGAIEGARGLHLGGIASHLEVTVSLRGELRFLGPLAAYADAGWVALNEYRYRPRGAEDELRRQASGSAQFQAGLAISLQP